jgi:hypothetical protein
MFWFVPCAFSSTNNFAHAQTLYRVLIHIHTKYDGCGPQDKKSFALEKIKLLI